MYDEIKPEEIERKDHRDFVASVISLTDALGFELTHILQNWKLEDPNDETGAYLKDGYQFYARAGVHWAAFVAVENDIAKGFSEYVQHILVPAFIILEGNATDHSAAHDNWLSEKPDLGADFQAHSDWIQKMPDPYARIETQMAAWSAQQSVTPPEE